MLATEEIKQLQQKICAENSEDAFGQLFMAFLPNLTSFAQSIIRNKELSEEIVSDVFIKVWQYRENLCKIDNLKLYLYVSIKNTAFNYLSRHYRKEMIAIDDMSLESISIQNNPEELLITSEALNRINAAIKMLPPRCKVIFKLAKEDGLKYSEIAQLLNISVNTIDNQMAIAVKKIAAAINFDLRKESR